MDLVEVHKIWDEAPHNAFTDLIHFNGQWYCAFREGQNHVSDDGVLRVIRSVNGTAWEPVVRIASDGGDVRDAKLAATADGQLMLSGAVRFLEPKDGNRHQSVTWISADGETWGEPHACPTGLGTWRWSVTWYGGFGYSFGYSGKDPAGCLYRTSDSKTWQVVRDRVYPDAESYGNETSILFREDGTAHCLLRRDKGSCTGMLGDARPPYTDWRWRDLNVRIGGPKMIELSGGRLLATVRLYDEPVRTSVCWIDSDEPAITESLVLPSGGDTSYAGMVERDGVVWISYYSSHEGKTSIYLAKVRPDRG